MLYEEFQSLKQVQDYALKCNHRLIIKDDNYILVHMDNANKLTYKFLHEVIGYLQRLEKSWIKKCE